MSMSSRDQDSQPVPQYSKALDLAEDLAAYLRAHPEQRFWQGLLNWSGLERLEATRVGDPDVVYDTYYWQGKKK